MTRTKELFHVKWICNFENNNFVQDSYVKAKNIKGACMQVENREGYIDTLSAKMWSHPYNTGIEIETSEDYKKLKNNYFD